MRRFGFPYFINAFLMAFLIYLYQTSKLDNFLLDDTRIMVPTIIFLGVAGWFLSVTDMGRSRWKNVLIELSSLLVGLGFLGTLTGTAMALSVFHDVNAGDNDMILKLVGEFMSGVSIAINTSIWGVIFSSIILMNTGFFGDE